MKPQTPIFIVVSFVTILFLSIACAGNRKVLTESDNQDSFLDSLPLPQPPEHFSNKEKLAFILYHFWDSVNFKNHNQSLRRDYMEQNFANFAYILNNTKDTIAKKEAIVKVLQEAEQDSAAFALFHSIAYDYLYDPDSPMMNEETYIPFMIFYKNSDILDEVEKYRNDFFLSIALKNRVGTKATDFSFETSEGKPNTLYKFPVNEGSQLLLIFYDPDCDSCKDTIRKLSENKKLHNSISEKKLKVLAIYSGEDKDLWKKSQSLFPKEWTIGYEDSSIDEEELYFFRSYPTLYLLDSAKTVLMKDLNPDSLF